MTTKTSIICWVMVIVSAGSVRPAVAQGDGAEADEDRLRRAVAEFESELLRNGFKAWYEVERRVIGDDRALSFVQMPGDGGNAPTPYWYAELARKGMWTYEFLSGSRERLPADKDPKAQERIFMERYGWMRNTAYKTINFSKGDKVVNMRKVLYPIQDIYSEAIGLEAANQSIYNTFVGQSDEGREFSLSGVRDDQRYSNIYRDKEKVDGIDCVLIESVGDDRIWVAPDYGYSLVKREWHWSPGGPVKILIRNSEFKKFQTNGTDGIWLPMSSRVEYYGHPDDQAGQLAMTATIDVNKIEVSIDDKIFMPFIKPGTEVWEFGRDVWIMPAATGKSLDDIINASSSYGSEIEVQDEVEERAPLTITIVIGAIVALVLASLAVWVIMNRKRRLGEPGKF